MLACRRQRLLHRSRQSHQLHLPALVARRPGGGRSDTTEQLQRRRAQQPDRQQPAAQQQPDPQQQKQQQPDQQEQPLAARAVAGRAALAVGLIAAAGAIAASSPGGFSGLAQRVNELEALVASSGPLGPLIFVSTYVVATVLLFPASVLTLAGGYLFGPVQGTALVSLSATSGACVAFLVSRFLARPLVERQLARRPKLRAVVSSVTASGGAKLVLLLRLSPLVPFSLINFGLGVTPVRFLDYAAASWLGMLPATAAYVYLGSLGRVAADAATDGAAAGFDGVRLAMYVVGAAATIYVTKLISQAASAAINEQQQQQEQHDGAGDS